MYYSALSILSRVVKVVLFNIKLRDEKRRNLESCKI